MDISPEGNLEAVDRACRAMLLKTMYSFVWFLFPCIFTCFWLIYIIIIMVRMKNLEISIERKSLYPCLNFNIVPSLLPNHYESLIF